ncbi:MAG: hypothetical protein Q3966_07320 [Neisseria sp.]|nr:hypothetical protein [Neisseria sp.]
MWKNVSTLCRSGAALAAVLALSGCFTKLIWNEDPVTHTETVLRDAGSDQIRAFGVVREKNSQLAVDSLVMMGDKYWYVLDAASAHHPKALLNTGMGFKKPFAIGDSKGNETGRMVVRLKGRQDFYSEFCLLYQTDTPDERAVLEKAGFTPRKDKDRLYGQCLAFDGKFYAVPKNAKYDYRFETPIQVVLQSEVSKTSVNGAGLVGKILLTPVTLVMDALTAVVALPLSMSLDRHTNP